MADRQPKTARNKSEAVLAMSYNAIDNRQVSKLTKLLKLIPIDSMVKESSDQILYSLLVRAGQNSAYEFVEVIFDSWRRVHPPEEDQTLFTTLFYNLLFDVHVLRFCAVAMRLTTYAEIASSLILRGDVGNICMTALMRLDKVYGERGHLTYQQLYDMAKDINPAAENYLSDKLRQTAEYAPIPEYVRTFLDDDGSLDVDNGIPIIVTDDTELPVESDLEVDDPPPVQFDIPSIAEMVEELTAGMGVDGKTEQDINAMKDIWRATLATATLADKIELIRPIREIEAGASRQYDRTLFRLFGPANPFVNSDVEALKFGGARMFTDMTFEYDPEEFKYDDWFVGACIMCNKRIRRRWHAVRIPKPLGGWKGCFCNFDCGRQAIVERVNEGDEKGVDVLTDFMMDKFEEQLYTFGIQDRISEEEYIERATEIEDRIRRMVVEQELNEDN